MPTFEGGLWWLLCRTAQRHPRGRALSTGQSSFNWLELQQAAAAAAAELRGPETPVALMLGNTPEFAAWFFGARAAGRAVVPLDPAYPDHEIAARLADTAAGAAITTGESRDRIARLAPGIRLVAGHWPRTGAKLPPPDRPEDLAVLQYTSGTTGGRKAAMMSGANLVANAWQNNVWFDWSHRDVILGALPLSHTWGLSCVLIAATMAGAETAFPISHSSADLATVIPGKAVTVAYGSATMWHRLLDHVGAEAPRTLASLRYVKAGAMLVGGGLPARWSEAVPQVPMILGYGLTEASPEVSNNPPGRVIPGTVGVPLPGTSVRICSPADPEAEAAAGSVGEIQVRGPQVMKGYWRRPDATRSALLPGGWLRTGDLGLVENGYLTVVDRIKDLIKFRGWSVVPGEVERALLDHPAVKEVVVVAVPHERDGEWPVACLVSDRDLTETEMQVFLESRLAHYQIPRRLVRLESIPKNSVGKPLRRVLRDQLAEDYLSPSGNRPPPGPD